MTMPSAPQVTWRVSDVRRYVWTGGYYRRRETQCEIKAFESCCTVGRRSNLGKVIRVLLPASRLSQQHFTAPRPDKKDHCNVACVDSGVGTGTTARYPKHR
jgi:hypothetical protein